MINLVLGLALASSGAAQEPPTGSRLGKGAISGFKFSEQESAEAAQQFASCLFTKRERLARDMLLAENAETAAAVSEKLFGSGVTCLNLTNMSDMSDTRTVNADAPLMRGMLAEAALKKSPAAVAALPAMPIQKVYERSWLGITGRNSVVDEMAVCIAETNPAAVGALLKTRVFTKEEAAAFGALSPSFAPCLRAGARLQANKQSMRAALADALFHRINEPVAPPATGKGQ